MMETKTCCLCGKTKPITRFAVKSASRDGRTARCKDCLPIRVKESPVPRDPVSPGLRAGNLVALRRTGKDKWGRWVWLFQCDCGNQKEIAATEVFGKKIATRSCGCAHPGGRGNPNSNFNTVVNIYRLGAIRRGYAWELSDSQAYALFMANCHYCGASPSTIYAVTNAAYPFIRNGIDRANSDEGYTEENCVPCCKRCNMAKGVMNYDEFIEFVKAVYDHRVRE